MKAEDIAAVDCGQIIAKDKSCLMSKLREISGTLIKGYGAAGGDPNYKRGGLGCIAMQAPHFRERGLDWDMYFPNGWKAATLNVDIAPYVVSRVHPDYSLRDVKWDPNDTPEDFLITGMSVIFKGKSHKAALYFVDPATKQNCFQNKGTMEIIAEPIDGIAYGDTMTLAFDPEKIVIKNAPSLAKTLDSRRGRKRYKGTQGNTP